MADADGIDLDRLRIRITIDPVPSDRAIAVAHRYGDEQQRENRTDDRIIVEEIHVAVVDDGYIVMHAEQWVITDVEHHGVHLPSTGIRNDSMISTINPP